MARGRAADYIEGMDLLARRRRLARFIDRAVESPAWPQMRPLARIPIDRAVLRVCRDTLRDIADVLRDTCSPLDAAAVADLERLLTRAGESPLYGGGHPLRALHALVAIESRLQPSPTWHAA